MNADVVFADAAADLFAELGVAALVVRGADAPVPVLIIVQRDQERIGEYGTAATRVDTVAFRVDEWTPRAGDLVTWADRLGTHARKVDGLPDNDGFVATAVLHG
ncbi:hypothetical protein [Pseudoxanthomonas winnipegensis]|uniref:Uncharacterized protein n=1 Tax=Pseudoxanthomonas winnipegensis TaxID=2480810 RepID=A0A4Q8M8J2_9GAMM|nr:hypothetical protein [Pseudoxanthomonas winnipegensis]TAA45647.1 hypothetical protein EA655_05520 [Pseudoxanthomonas winnipegensis]